MRQATVYSFGRHLIWVLLVREVFARLTAVRALGAIFSRHVIGLVGWRSVGDPQA